MRLFHFAIVVLFAIPCFSQEHKVPNPSNDKAVEWVDIPVPKFPALARQARIFGTVAIEVRFKGCELDPASPRIVTGHPILAPAAMESLKQSTFRCGDRAFPDSNATLYYEFGEYPAARLCEGGFTRVDVVGSHIQVLTTAACLNTITNE